MSINDYCTALVTGATGGIGEAIVAMLTEKNITVHAVGRRREALDKLSRTTGCFTHQLDMRDVEAVYDLISDLDIDILINNAGVGSGFDGLDKLDPNSIDIAIDTNVKSVVHSLRAVLPAMKANKHGHIVNIGSMAGLYALSASLYGATKGAIHMLSRDLRLELQGSGIRVTEVCPGRVKTGFYDVAIKDPQERQKVKESGIRELDPWDVAEAVIYAINVPCHVNVNLIELQPTEQTYGGSQFKRIDY